MMVASFWRCYQEKHSQPNLLTGFEEAAEKRHVPKITGFLELTMEPTRAAAVSCPAFLDRTKPNPHCSVQFDTNLASGADSIAFSWRRVEAVNRTDNTFPRELKSHAEI